MQNDVNNDANTDSAATESINNDNNIGCVHTVHANQTNMVKKISLTNPQLCIPRVSVEITQHTIFKAMCALNIGYIEKIIEHLSKTNDQYKRVIICVKWNPITDSAKNIYERIMRQEPVYVVYEMPFYWKIVRNKLPGTVALPPPAYTSV